MQSQTFTDYCVLVCFALCYIIIIRLFYYIYIFLIPMQRHRFRNVDKIDLPEDFVEKFDEEKWLLQQQHEILKTKYKCLKQLFHVYNTNVLVHYKNNSQATKLKQSSKTLLLPCKYTISSKNSDYENSGTDITKFNYEIYKPEAYNQTKRARTIAVQTEEPTVRPINITNKGGYHALNLTEIPVQYEIDNKSPSKISIFKNYIQKVLGQNREADRPPRIRNRRHITFNFSKKSLHRSSHKNVGRNDFSIDNNPLIVSLVEVARKSCLADMSLRRCRVHGCGYIGYGIIEYNTHMNAAHYPERKYICYFCHESFDKACDKFLHENKHLGVKFDLTSGPSKCDTCQNQIKRTISKNTNFVESIDFNIKNAAHQNGKKKFKIFKDINVSITPSESTQTTIYKHKQSLKRKPKCPHTISSIYQSDNEISDCVSSKNLSNNTNLAENFPENLKKVSCRFCQKSFDSKCKLLYHINLKHADVLKSDIVTSSAQKGDKQFKKSGKELESKTSNSKCTESVCLSHETKKSSKVCRIINKVKNGFFKYTWEPGTRIIRI